MLCIMQYEYCEEQANDKSFLTCIWKLAHFMYNNKNQSNYNIKRPSLQ